MTNKMKGRFVGIFLVCLVLCSLYYVFYAYKNSQIAFESNLTSEDSALQNRISENCQNEGYTKTGFTWKDSKGDKYPVYIAHTGSCFVIKTSKSGEDYRAYLGEEVSEQIRKELSKSDTRRDRHCFKNRTLKQ